MVAFVLIAGAVLLCGLDLWCKSYVEEHFKYGEEREVCDGKIFLRRVHNEGMALNIGEKKPKMIRFLTGIVCAVLTIYYVVLLRKDGNLVRKKGMTLILAGAFSNGYDRFVRKYVVDYFGFKSRWKKLSDITFNLGDLFIFLGAGILVIRELLGKKK